jgi:preprotein translocase subunit YajC
MTISLYSALLAMGAPPPGTANPQGEMIKTLGMFALMGVMFYVILIRPQRMRAKQLEKTVQSLKAGDKIVTNSGIVGIIVTVKDKTLSIRSADAKLEILKSAVTEITERSGEPSPANP